MYSARKVHYMCTIINIRTRLKKTRQPLIAEIIISIKLYVKNKVKQIINSSKWVGDSTERLKIRRLGLKDTKIEEYHVAYK